MLCAAGWRGPGVGDVNISFYTTRQRDGRPKWGYWAPCLKRRSKRSGRIEETLMAKLGFALVDCGEDGPRAWAIAQNWNAKWKQARADHLAGKPVQKPGKIERVFPPNSLGEGFAKFRATGEWSTKKPRTREGWLRGWKLIEPTFGDVNPRTVAMEHIDLWYHGDSRDPKIKGILELAGVSEAYIGMKYWRAIWSVLMTINRADGERYCVGEDPSLGIRRKTPQTRTAIWLYDEAQLTIGAAGKMKILGLQAALSVAWDTMMSPVDVRTLTLSQMSRDAQGTIFQVDRAKTGRQAIGTLTEPTLTLLNAYVAGLPFTLHPETPIFHTRGGQPGPKGGRPRPPVPYTKDTLSKDFRDVRAALFIGDTRKVMDFRRSGSVEAIAGQVDPSALAGKMANSIDTNKKLQQTYLPNQTAVVRLADEARVRGRVVMRGLKNEGGT
jgi:integrase